jgi:hypothetical protein
MSRRKKGRRGQRRKGKKKEMGRLETRYRPQGHASEDLLPSTKNLEAERHQAIF